MSTRNLCFRWEIRKIFKWSHLLSRVMCNRYWLNEYSWFHINADRERCCYCLINIQESLKYNVNPSLAEHNMTCLSKQCRSRSVVFFRSQLIWICTVCLQICEFLSKTWIKWADWLEIRSGHGILIYSAWQGLKCSICCWSPDRQVSMVMRWACHLKFSLCETVDFAWLSNITQLQIRIFLVLNSTGHAIWLYD